MRVFLSWSGERSHVVADALRNWLQTIFYDVSVWMSEHDIDAGVRWSAALGSELESSNFGILCLTPENLSSPWLLFEAGSLAKAVADSRVVPYRLGISATDVGFPLAQFQGVDADEAGTSKLVNSHNEARERPLSKDQIQRIFSKWWPDLQSQLAAVPQPQATAGPRRSDRALLEEILELVRSRNTPGQSAPDPSTIWIKQRTIYEISPDEMLAMSTPDLERYIGALRERWNITSSRGEEDYLEGKMQQAKDELSRRRPSGVS